MKFAWNAQKNKMKDMKGKEMEQERKGRIKNDEIDPDRSHLNYDFIESDMTLYQRTKERVEELKKTGSRVQENSVISYSNIFTIPSEDRDRMTDEQTHEYFSTIVDYFKEEFGEENVLSGKVHLDETTPHMHLHFMPVNKENGRLQAHKVMNRAKMNKIHSELPKLLQEKGFEVERGDSRDKSYIKDIHMYKAVREEVREIHEMIETLNVEGEPGIYRVPYLKIGDEDFELYPIAEKRFEERKEKYSLERSSDVEMGKLLDTYIFKTRPDAQIEGTMAFINTLDDRLGVYVRDSAHFDSWNVRVDLENYLKRKGSKEVKEISSIIERAEEMKEKYDRQSRNDLER